MLDLARSAGTEMPVSLAAVANTEKLSRGYLEQLALSLRTAQLLRGVCGKGGGYRLAREPEEITVREVIEAVLGPINIVECVEKPNVCPRSDTCECRGVYVLINHRITEALEGFTLADLLDPERLQCLSAEASAADRHRTRGEGRKGSRLLGQRPAARHGDDDAGGCPGG
jgi:Rrf2 family transcriptional regulator, cysteine metabolism repressor